jgi:hypothetical protein
MLDSIPAAVFLLANGERVLYANARGEELLQKAQVLAIDLVTRKLRPYWVKARLPPGVNSRPPS